MEQFAIDMLIEVWGMQQVPIPIAVVADLESSARISIPSVGFNAKYDPGHYILTVNAEDLGGLCVSQLTAGRMFVHPVISGIMEKSRLSAYKMVNFFTGDSNRAVQGLLQKGPFRKVRLPELPFSAPYFDPDLHFLYAPPGDIWKDFPLIAVNKLRRAASEFKARREMLSRTAEQNSSSEIVANEPPKPPKGAKPVRRMSGAKLALRKLVD